MYIQCSKIVKKDPFYMNFWTSVIPPVDMRVPPGILPILDEENVKRSPTTSCIPFAMVEM